MRRVANCYTPFTLFTYFRMAEVRAVLKKMKRHKAPGLSGLIEVMIQATVDIGTQWILDLCNGVVKEGSIPEDWKSADCIRMDEVRAALKKMKRHKAPGLKTGNQVWYCQSTKAKTTLWSVDRTDGSNCWNML